MDPLKRIKLNAEKSTVGMNSSYPKAFQVFYNFLSKRFQVRHFDHNTPARSKDEGLSRRNTSFSEKTRRLRILTEQNTFVKSGS